MRSCWVIEWDHFWSCFNLCFYISRHVSQCRLIQWLIGCNIPLPESLSWGLRGDEPWTLSFSHFWPYWSSNTRCFGLYQQVSECSTPIKGALYILRFSLEVCLVITQCFLLSVVVLSNSLYSLLWSTKKRLGMFLFSDQGYQYSEAHR